MEFETVPRRKINDRTTSTAIERRVEATSSSIDVGSEKKEKILKCTSGHLVHIHEYKDIVMSILF